MVDGLVLAGVIQDLQDVVSTSSWTYPAIMLAALLDAFIPIVPSETMVIAAGVLSASGDLHLSLVIAMAAVGAIVGDHVSYLIGRTLGGRYQHRLFGGKRRKQLLWAERMLQERGGYLIVIARFIPGGRTATTFAAGLLRFRWRRFFVFDVVAGVIWGCYGGLIGYFGGKAFEESPLKGIIVALAVALGIAVGVEIYRWSRKRAAAGREPQRGRDVVGEGAKDPDEGVASP